MSALRPGMVVSSIQSNHLIGLLVDMRYREPGRVPVYDVEWMGGTEATNLPSVSFQQMPAAHVQAGDVFDKLEVLEVDMTAELMKVRVGEHRLPNWVDVRLTRLPASWATRADQVREKYIAEDRQKLDWFKPGQIVRNKDGDTVLARPATVIEQVSATEVKVVTSNGIATVPFQYLTLSANSVQDLQAKEAQKRENLLTNFKDEVREKAMDAASEHGWCSEVKEILTGLGIRTKVSKVRAVLHLTVEVEAVLNEETGMTRLDLDHNNNRAWWGNTLEFTDDGKDLSLKDDDDVDMGSAEVRLISSRVEEIHDESYLEE